jgi:hypothetical protein
MLWASAQRCPLAIGYPRTWPKRPPTISAGPAIGILQRRVRRSGVISILRRARKPLYGTRLSIRFVTSSAISVGSGVIEGDQNLGLLAGDTLRLRDEIGAA